MPIFPACVTRACWITNSSRTLGATIGIIRVSKPIGEFWNRVRIDWERSWVVILAPPTEATTLDSALAVSPGWMGARLTTIPIDITAKTAMRKYFLIASLLLLINRYMMAPGECSKPIYYRGDAPKAAILTIADSGAF